jgi:hypothetical protein
MDSNLEHPLRPYSGSDVKVLGNTTLTMSLHSYPLVVLVVLV